MNKYLLLSAADDRRPMLEACIRSIREYLPDWKLAFTAQLFPADGYLENLLNGMDYFLKYEPERSGAHSAKLAGLNWIADREGDRPYAVCNIDDDMEFTRHTNLDPAVWFAMEPGVGFVSANWARTETDYEKKVGGIREEMKVQPIVYTGGGMVFNHTVAQMIRDMGPADFICDNSEWSLAAYLSGRSNYRFLGSLCIHRIGSKGGRRSWLDMEERQLPDPRYLGMREAGVGFNGKNKYRIGDSKDLTPLAKETHLKNRRTLMEQTYG